MSVVTINGVSRQVPEGTGLGKLLAEDDKIQMPCGGHGRCGKCKVKVQGETNPLTETERRFLSGEEIAGGMRLACLCAAEGDCTVWTARQETSQVAVGSTDIKILLKPTFLSYGCAVDIGTTTLAAGLWDRNGKCLARAGGRNPQAGWGAEVVSRTEAAMGGAGEKLRTVICKAVDDLLLELASEAGIPVQEIGSLVITGNTVMLHLFTGTDPEPLSHAPFAVKRRFGENLAAGSLGLTAVAPDTCVYLPPCMSAFAGADLVTALLASGICERAGTQMLADIGTNGEMALVRSGELYVCSAAAGPAFEGAGLSCGMQGKVGAIDKVRLRGRELEAHVIGKGPALGICGSGAVDAIACLLECGRIEDTGYMEEERIVIIPPVAITQEDVHMVQLAKGAVHGGIRTLLHAAGTDDTEVSGLYIAGGFGSYLNVENAGRIGLIPNELVPKVHVIGNAALEGAVMLLLNGDYRGICRKYADAAKKIELSDDPFFSEAYVEEMMF